MAAQVGLCGTIRPLRRNALPAKKNGKRDYSEVETETEAERIDNNRMNRIVSLPGHSRLYTRSAEERKEMRPQPDFTRLFFEHFGTRPRKVVYEMRQGAFRLHDLVFLESLIHDATFSGKDVRLSGEN